MDNYKEMSVRHRLALIANLYYKEKLSQMEIAQRFGLSRPQVSRLLAQAVEKGIVHIIIDEFDDNAYELEEKLKVRFGLKEAVIVYQKGLTDDAIRKNIGDAAAKFLQNSITDSDYIGVTSGQTLWETSHFLQR
ncbi:MAG: sugar-binding domain-containing protein [Bacillota bacterium]|jgi:deoxyribonucleoside regulator